MTARTPYADRLFVLSPEGDGQVRFSSYLRGKLVNRSTVPTSEAQQTIDLINAARTAAIDAHRQPCSVARTQVQHEQLELRAAQAKEAFFEAIAQSPSLGRLYQAWRLADRDVFESSRSLRDVEGFQP